jgi:nicotinamidase-related amidase
MISFISRHFEAANELDRYTDENDSRWVEARRELPLRECAFLLMDVWARHPNDGWRARGAENVKNHLAPLLNRLRGCGATILHAWHGQPQHELAQTLPGEWDLHSDGLETCEALSTKLKAAGIRNLFYTGYASNWCILNRDVGMINMKKAGFQVFLIRDCSLAFETKDTLQGEWAHYVTVNTIEHQWGETLLATDLTLPAAHS